MTRVADRARIEPRWEAAVTLVSLSLLITALPGRIRLLPHWAIVAAVFAVLGAMVAVVATRGGPRALRAERVITVLIALAAMVVNLANLGTLVDAMIHRGDEFDGLTLLVSSVAVWVVNVLTFSLLYWHLDRGGPEARVRGDGVPLEWLFPQDDAPDTVAPGWRPAFVDYLFLSYTAVAAFSPTDVMPLSPRAKILMMLESTIALVTVVVVGARAIGILAP